MYKVRENGHLASNSYSCLTILILGDVPNSMSESEPTVRKILHLLSQHFKDRSFSIDRFYYSGQEAVEKYAGFKEMPTSILASGMK